jgi:hypothetical protein
MADNNTTDEATRSTELDQAQAPSPAKDLVPVHKVGGLPVPQTTPLPATKKSPKKN